MATATGVARLANATSPITAVTALRDTAGDRIAVHRAMAPSTGPVHQGDARRC
jgi:hypothetical protein